MSTQLEQIAAKAKADRTLRFTSLAHLLTPAFLIETWRQMNRRGASRVDGETTTEFERELATRVQDICARLKAGTYRAPPVRRVEIPKGPGKLGTRPLGIPTVEDRLVQRAVARIVEAVFEADFLDCSYGFRPKRSPHHALRTLRATLVTKKVRHLYEADIRGYVNHINHRWLMRIVAHRIADGVILRLIGKWLRAGVMQDGVIVRTEAGTPQGGPLSPLLSNVVLDELDRELEHRGHRFVRYADDSNIYVRSERAGQRVMESITRFITATLKLKVNETKSAVARPQDRKFLGFSFTAGPEVKRTIAPQALDRFKARVRTITRRAKGVSIETTIEELWPRICGAGAPTLASAKHPRRWCT